MVTQKKNNRIKGKPKKNGGRNAGRPNSGSSGPNKFMANALTRVNRVVTAPLQKARVVSVGTPSLSGSRNCIRVRFRELILTSLASAPTASTFNLVGTIEVNPGLRASFPWLSSIAANYEQYRVHRMSFQYVNAAPATRQGFMYMVPDYDVYDAAPSTPQGAMNQMGSVSTPIWSSVSMPLRIQAAMAIGPRRFIRQVASGRDQSLCDVALVHIFYSDLSSTDPLPGQVWVDYDIELFAPQMIPSVVTARTVTEFDDVTSTLAPFNDGVLQLLPLVVKDNGLSLIPVLADNGFYLNGARIFRYISNLNARIDQSTLVGAYGQLKQGYDVLTAAPTEGGTVISSKPAVSYTSWSPDNQNASGNTNFPITNNMDVVIDSRNYSAPLDSRKGLFFRPNFSQTNTNNGAISFDYNISYPQAVAA